MPLHLRSLRTRADCGRLVSGSFQTSSEALFSFHSRYYCAIGLGAYLRLGVDAPRFHARFPTHATRDTWNAGVGFSSTVLSTSMRPVFHRFRLTRDLLPRSRTPHLPSLSGGIRFAVFRFRSPLLTESRLISFPPSTKMLHFEGCPLLTEGGGVIRRRKSHSVIPVSTSPCDYAGHIVAWRDLPRLPSRAIPQAASAAAHSVGSTSLSVNRMVESSRTSLARAVGGRAASWESEGTVALTGAGPLPVLDSSSAASARSPSARAFCQMGRRLPRERRSSI